MRELVGRDREYADGRASWWSAACAQIASGRDGSAFCDGCACDRLCGQPSARAFCDERATAIVGSLTALFLCGYYADRTADRTTHAETEAHLWITYWHFVHSPTSSWAYLLYP